MANNKINKTKSNCSTNSKGGKFNSSGRRKNSKSKVYDTEFKSSNAESAYASNTSGYNDVSWYTRNSAAAEAATRISMNVPAGSFIHRMSGRSQTSLRNSALPSVMAFNTMPTIGVGSTNAGKNDAINLAAVKIYSKIRQMNTGSSSYDQRTMMQFFMAMDSIYSAYAYFVRVYKTLNLYSAENRNVPDVLLHAMGLTREDVNTLRTQMSDFYFWLINLQEQINMWHVPGDMDIIQRHYWLYSNIYTDSESSKASFYLFKPAGFYKWMEDNGEFVLKIDTTIPLVYTVPGMRMFMDDLMAPLFRSQDFMTINGDVLKVYSLGQCFSVHHPLDTDVIAPVHNKEVLMQINNLVMTGYEGEEAADALPHGNYAIYEDTDNFILVQDIIGSVYASRVEPILNFYHDNPTSGEILVATRLMFTSEWDRLSNDKNVSRILTCGADIVINATIYDLYQANPNGDIEIDATTIESFMLNSQNWDVLAPRLAAFDYHPPIYVMNATDAMTMKNLDDVNDVVFDNVVSVYFDFDNAVYLPSSAVEQLNVTCNYSLFGVV